MQPPIRRHGLLQAVLHLNLKRPVRRDRGSVHDRQYHSQQDWGGSEQTFHGPFSFSASGPGLTTPLGTSLDKHGSLAMSESCPKVRGELLGRQTLANEKMVNRVGCHKGGVTLRQM